MKVSVGFPLGTDGPLGRAAAAATRHPSYRVEGVNGSARVSVELDLPDDWRLLDDFSSLLRGEEGAEYAANGASVSGDELFEGLRCFLRKQRSGASARDWCTPARLADKQLFPCKQIHLYDNDHLTDNSWYAFGRMDEDGAYLVDKEAITERVLSDLGPCVRCPILDLDTTAEIVARLPERIEPGKEVGWGYREDGPLPNWKVVKTPEGREAAETAAQEEREGLIERLARSVRDGGAGVATVAGGSVGSRNVPATRYEDVGGMRETITLVREAVELPITHPEIFRKLNIRPHKGILFYGPPGTGKTLLARAVAHESGAHFIAVSGPEILNKYWGHRYRPAAPWPLRPRDRDRATRCRGTPPHPGDPPPVDAHRPRPRPEAHSPAHGELLGRRPGGPVPRGRPGLHAPHDKLARPPEADSPPPALRPLRHHLRLPHRHEARRSKHPALGAFRPRRLSWPG